jgi:hypothetical protein
LGYSDHKAKILCINDENPKTGLTIVRKWHFTGESVGEFKYLLHQESWQEVFVYSELNTKFYVFMDAILYHFNTALPLKSV